MINYPVTCVTNGSKLSWLNRFMKLLHIEHNIMGAWKSEGITLTEYQKLRAQVQIDFPYKEGVLSDSDWDRYKTDRFMKKFQIVSDAIGQLREACMISTTYSPNLDDDVTID